MSSLLLENDLKTIASKLHLPIAKTEILTEEESDLDLVLNSISNENFARRDRQDFSFKTYCRILTNRLIKDLSISEKTWIADCLNLHTRSLQKYKKKSFLVPKNLNTSDTGFYFILLALYPDKFKVSITSDRLAVRVENGLYAMGYKDLAKNLEKYLKIISSARDEGWFD